MGLTLLAVKRPLTMLMIISAIVILGWQGFNRMLVDRFPAVDFPFITVVTAFPGASPEDVEDLVVKPIEDAVAGLPGIDFVQSISNEGLGIVIVAFQEGVDGDQAAIDVERQVSTVRAFLPSEATDPSVVKADINAVPIMNIIVSGPQSQDELFKLTEDVIKPRLQTIKGIASTSVTGGRDRIIAVQIDGEKLAAYNLPIDVVNQAFALKNLTFPVGTISEGNSKSSIRSVGSFQSLPEIEGMVISGGPSALGSFGPQAPAGADTGGLVYLSDVATIEDTFEDASVFQRYNGQDTVAISIIKSNDANVVEVAERVRKRIDDLNKTLPGGAKITVVSDDSNFVQNSVKAVQEDLILAVLITGLVMLFFLHTIRSTFIVLLAIPTSLFATFLVMWALGFTLNVLTLLALTLIIGILVDDSIVVLENIERHIKMKKHPKEAAIDGRAEIGLAAIAITLTDVVVYVPVAFTSGIIGQFFRSYGITIVVATMFSLFVSFTLTPMLSAYWLKDESKPEAARKGLAGFFGKITAPFTKLWWGFISAWEAGFVWLANIYSKLIGLSLKNFFTQSAIILIAVVALVGSFMLAPSIGFEFAPQEDDGRILISVELPSGTILSATDEATRRVEQLILQEVPETVSILTQVGSGGSDGINVFSGGGLGGENTASLTVQMTNKNDRERDINQILNELRPVLDKIPGADVSASAVGSITAAGGGLQIQIHGEDPDVLAQLGAEIEEVVRNTPGTIDVSNDGADRTPEARLILDQDRLSNLGLSPAQVASTLRTALTGADAGDFAPIGQEKIEINVRMDEQSRESLEKLLQLSIGNLNGNPILLSQVATIERSSAPATINRNNRQRVINITSGVIGADAGGIANEVGKRIDAQVNFPPEYGYEFAGATETQQESFGQLGSALLLSIVLIYMLLVGLYENFLQPLAIMFALPLALIGVLWGLYLTGNSLNIFSMLGIIMLAGIVTRNAILIIDFANQLQREQGMERKAALVEAGRLRLRPILMTSATLIFALLPVLLSTADGSESRQPLAAVIMGGSVTSGFLSLLVIPVAYNALEVLSGWIIGLWNWITGKPDTPSDSQTPDTPTGTPPKPAPKPKLKTAPELAPSGAAQAVTDSPAQAG